MNQSQTAAAIAQQEEHLKRLEPCEGVRYRPHQFQDFGRPAADGTIAGAAMWRECLTCGVTETDEDYQIKIATDPAAG